MPTQEGQAAIDDEGSRSPRVTEHVDVGTEDATDPGRHGGGAEPEGANLGVGGDGDDDSAHPGGEELGGEDVGRAVGRGDGQLAEHGDHYLEDKECQQSDLVEETHQPHFFFFGDKDGYHQNHSRKKHAP